MLPELLTDRTNISLFANPCGWDCKFIKKIPRKDLVLKQLDKSVKWSGVLKATTSSGQRVKT